MNLLAATFGWLCVETPPLLLVLVKRQVAATFGWLCVETFDNDFGNSFDNAATFGWLCVETSNKFVPREKPSQPPSGGCVLKQL